MQEYHSAGLPITLVTTCKPFKGIDSTLQSNAIASWRALGFHVLILGDEPGVEEICGQLRCEQVSSVRKSEKNLPFVGSIFSIAESQAPTPYYAYLNSDIMLDRNAVPSLERFLDISDTLGNFLLTTRRKNIPLCELLDYQDGSAFHVLDRLDRAYGTWDHPYAIDFFLVNKGWLREIPDLLIGRAGWDNWMLHNARENGVSVIDASASFCLFHPLHGYKTVDQSGQDNRMNSESMQNKTIIGKISNSIENSATHLFGPDGVARIEDCPSAQYPVDMARLFVADIVAMQSAKLEGAKARLERLYTILHRSLSFISMTFPKVDFEDEIDAVFDRLVGLCRDKKAADARNELQDWLLSDFLSVVGQVSTAKRQTYIWGAGAAGERLHQFLARHDIEVSGVLDSRIPSGQQSEILMNDRSMALMPPEVLRDASPKPFVLLASMYSDEMTDYLNGAGYKARSDYAC